MNKPLLTLASLILAAGCNRQAVEFDGKIDNYQVRFEKKATMRYESKLYVTASTGERREYTIPSWGLAAMDRRDLAYCKVTELKIITKDQTQVFKNDSMSGKYALDVAKRDAEYFLQSIADLKLAEAQTDTPGSIFK